MSAEQHGEQQQVLAPLPNSQRRAPDMHSASPLRSECLRETDFAAESRRRVYAERQAGAAPDRNVAGGVADIVKAPSRRIFRSALAPCFRWRGLFRLRLTLFRRTVSSVRRLFPRGARRRGGGENDFCVPAARSARSHSIRSLLYGRRSASGGGAVSAMRDFANARPRANHIGRRKARRGFAAISAAAASTIRSPAKEGAVQVDNQRRSGGGGG